MSSAGQHWPDIWLVPNVCWKVSSYCTIAHYHAKYSQLKFVKCNPGGRKIDLVSWLSELLSQNRYRCVQYTKRQFMSLISHCLHGFYRSCLIWVWYLCLRWSALPAVQAISRINSILKSANSMRNGTSKVIIGLCDGVWYIQHNGTILITVSPILTEIGHFVCPPK